MPAACSVDRVHVVIMGCGRVGSALARELEALGHSVAVIDRDAGAFRRLSADFSGRTVTGVGFDRDTLLEAGIDRAHAFAAVSSGDNSNIIAARVARETFGLDNVVARIYDARRAAVYQKLGIPTVATVRWTADQVIRRLLPEGQVTEWRDPSAKVVLAEVAYDASPGSASASRRLERDTGARVALLTRLGDGMLPHAETVLQEGDLLHVTVHTDRLEQVIGRPGRRPAGRGLLVRVAIAGAGNVGRSIATELLGNGHEVLLIEREPRAMKVDTVPSAEWLLADACELDTLVTARLQSCAVVVAATGDDKANLVLSLLAKTEFGVDRVVAKVNHPKNEWLFNESWGVDVAVSSPRLLAAVVEEAVSVGDLVRLLTFQKGEANLVELTLADDAPIVGRLVGTVPWPNDCALVAVLREGRVIVPTPDAALEGGDELLLVATTEVETELNALLGGHTA